jgi:hypothetical protein
LKPLHFEQTLSLADYERVRDLLRPLFIAEKDRRRLSVGDHLTLLFENTRTVWYQVHEMIRSERMSAREAVQHELDTYNELIPPSGELSATLLIQYPDAAQRDIELRKLLGLERHFWIVAGDRRELAHFDTRQMDTERISSVQFIRFPLWDPLRMVALARAGKLAVECDHPFLCARAGFSESLTSAVCEDPG